MLCTATIGKRDTVLDWHEYQSYGFETGNGFSFNDATGDALLATVQRATAMFTNKETWARIMMNGMSADLSWDASARKYVKLYEVTQKQNELLE